MGLTSAILVVAGCSSSGSSGVSAGNSGSGAHVSTVTIGDIDDFSGAASVYGISQGNGAQIAADQINAAGGIKSLGGAKVEIKKFDTASNPDDGPTQATAAVSAGVAGVIGGSISDTVIAGTNITQKADIPWITLGGTAQEIVSRGYNTVFSVHFDSQQLAQDWLGVIDQAASQLSLGAQPTVAIAYSDSSYGNALLSAFQKAAAGKVKVVTQFSYPQTTQDFSSVAARLASSSAQIVVNIGYPADGLALTRLFATSFTLPAKAMLMIGDTGQQELDQLKSQADGVVVNADLTPQVKSIPASYSTFYQAYEAKYHSAPNANAMSAYVAVQFLAAAIGAAKSTTPSAVVAALKNVTLTQTTGNVFPVPSTLSFAQDGSLQQAPFYAAQIESGQEVMLYPSGIAQQAVLPYAKK
jgi:branched-chain amino acid transport system substrate-binding protein